MDEFWQPRVTTWPYARGLVESYFLKLNHPEGEWAAWVKYTFLIRRGSHHPTGDCWLVFFDRTGTLPQPVTALRESFDLPHSGFGDHGHEIALGPNVLTPGICSGSLAGGQVRWRFSFVPDEPSMLLLPRPLYSPLSPTAKLSSPFPLAWAEGDFEVHGHTFTAAGYPLMVGHNWGHRHTPSYVWGQARAETPRGRLLFEGAALPVRVSAATPQPTRMTVGRVRYAGLDIPFNTPRALAANRSSAHLGRWEFELRNRTWRLAGELTFAPPDVAGLRYIQPDGAIHACLNSMVASGRLALYRGPHGTAPEVTAELHHSAALEFLSPDVEQGIPLIA